MKRLCAPLLLSLVASPALAQKPWEVRVDLPVDVPVELPAVPPTNPFAAAVEAIAVPATTPLLAKHEAALPALAAVYVDRVGACRRAVLLDPALPALAGELAAGLLETTFEPAMERGEPAPAWLTVSFALAGRIKEARVLRLTPAPPDPAQPPRAAQLAPPPADPRDLALPATPLERLERLPAVKRFRVSLAGRSVRQPVTVLAEVTPQGRCARVVFLASPPALRDYLLRSLGAWTFRPALAGGAPTAAWVLLSGELELELSGLSAEGLKLSRQALYPSPPAPAAAPPRGA